MSLKAIIDINQLHYKLTILFYALLNIFWDELDHMRRLSATSQNVGVTQDGESHNIICIALQEQSTDITLD